jgi:hypothetical protein
MKMASPPMAGLTPGMLLPNSSKHYAGGTALEKKHTTPTPHDRAPCKSWRRQDTTTQRRHHAMDPAGASRAYDACGDNRSSFRKLE